jgi:acetyl-CoA synthase
MSHIIASAAIRGAHKIAVKAEQMLAQSIEKNGRDCTVEFPNTAYSLPIIHSMLGLTPSNK